MRNLIGPLNTSITGTIVSHKVIALESRIPRNQAIDHHSPTEGEIKRDQFKFWNFETARQFPKNGKAQEDGWITVLPLTPSFLPPLSLTVLSTDSEILSPSPSLSHFGAYSLSLSLFSICLSSGTCFTLRPVALSFARCHLIFRSDFVCFWS